MDEIKIPIKSGITDVMEWIRDNGCPELHHTRFLKPRGTLYAIVSSVDKEKTMNFLNTTIDNTSDKWVDRNGMQLLNGMYSSYLLIGDKLYLVNNQNQ